MKLLAGQNVQNTTLKRLLSKYLLRLRGLELLLDLDLERLEDRGLTGLSFSCLIRTLVSRSGDSRRLCLFSLVILCKV